MKIKKIFIFVFIGLFLASCSATNYLTLKEIKESGKLIVTTNSEFAPFEYKEKGKFKGIDIEIIENYAKYIEGDDAWGYKKISNNECRKFDNGAMAVNSLANGQIDAVIIDEVPEKHY